MNRIPASISEALAAWCCAQDGSALPPEVAAKARHQLLDQIGVQLLGIDTPTVAALHQHHQATGTRGPATVLGRPATGTSPEMAALVNGTAGCAYENDDYHCAALVHPGAVVIPAALAAAEAAEATGERTLLAVAVGLEVVVRMGLATQPGLSSTRGFHGTSALGPFGAAAAAAVALGLTPAQTSHALGIAASHAGGTLEYTQSGGTVKQVHPGMAASGGLRSALLARHGITAPPTIFEGRRGFFVGLATEDAVPEALLDDLGTRWHMLDIAAKKHFTNACAQAPIEALGAIVAEEGIAAHEIEDVLVGLDPFAHTVCASRGPEVSSLLDAQFNLEHSLGMTVALGGNTLDHYRASAAEDFRNPAVMAVARRVRAVVDPEATAAFPASFLARVRVRAKGRPDPVERTSYAPGTSQLPLSPEEMAEKFQRNARSSISPDAADAIAMAVEELGAPGADLSSLRAALRSALPAAAPS